jgi:tripartite-type tricarboxylate transporter receptor subunit TctC
MFPGLAAALPHLKSGKLRAIAVTGTKRHPLIPDVPTLKELGYDGFDGVQWYGISGPAKLPLAIRDKLNAEINKAIQNPELKERLSAKQFHRCQCLRSSTLSILKMISTAGQRLQKIEKFPSIN